MDHCLAPYKNPGDICWILLSKLPPKIFNRDKLTSKYVVNKFNCWTFISFVSV